MPILTPSGTSYAPLLQATTTVQSVVNAVSMEVRGVLDSTVALDQTLLMSHINRAQLMLLRASRWQFLLSDVFYLITQREQSDYYIGPAGQAPLGVVDTLLNLNDIDIIMKNSVRDLTNDKLLGKTDERPVSDTLTTRDAQMRPGPPAEWRQDFLNPNILSIYPAPDNENQWQPSPQTPYLTITPGGALAARTYLVQITFVDSIGGEGSPCAREGLIEIPAGMLCVVNTPLLPYNVSSSGVSYNQYNVYAHTIPSPNVAPQYASTETLQTVTPIAIGANWTEPTTGLTGTGRTTPNGTNVTITAMDGYLIGFRYYQQRQLIQLLTDVLQTPDVYYDVLVAGATWYACQYLRLKDEAQYWNAMFQDGLRQMVRDKNLFPRENDYIAPDNATLGIGGGAGYQNTFDVGR